MRGFEASIVPIYQLAENAAKQFCDWAAAQRRETDFDPHVIGYPRSCMAQVTRAGETVAMLPLHPVLMLESFCHTPDLTASQRALALHAIDAELPRVMRDTGMHESYFTTSDTHFVMVATARGWENILHNTAKNTWLLRKRYANQS